MEYAQYKLLDSSGISWLQKKPIHWRIKRLKFSTELINNKVSVEESHLPYLGLEHIESWTGRKIDGEINNSEGLASSFMTGMFSSESYDRILPKSTWPNRMD